MLKIPKGLKKKKKGKKGKHKGEELFDPEELAELERYKKEKQQKEAKAAEAGAGTSESGEPAPAEEKEEWEKFKALTSGVDDILKKTQGELDRIKATSYYQKKPPGPSVPSRPTCRPVQAEAVVQPVKGSWVGFEEGLAAENNNETEAKADTATVGPTHDPFEAEHVEEEEEESEFEDDADDIFDTSYVDVVASGEVKLAYVPDSPEKEDDLDDPFDTSIVDKIIKVDPQEEKKKKLISLGSAVEVLTGKLDKPGEVPTEAVKAQRRRPRPRDLLLGSFDDGSGEVAENAEPDPAPKCILDDDPVFAEQTSEILGIAPVTPITEIKRIIVPTPKPPVKESPKNKGIDLKTLVDEFVPSFGYTDLNDKLVLVKPEVDEFDDEFAALAVESLHKGADKVKPPKPSPPQFSSHNVAPDEEEFDPEGDDPFDTSFASQVLPGKFELKLIEKEILDDHVSSIQTDSESKIKEVLKNSELSAKVKAPGNQDENSLRAKKDLLGGSTYELNTLAQSPIAPKSSEEFVDAFTSDDPFDTSVVVAPGKTEIKFLEQELLSNPVQFDDDDFDPRAEEKFDKQPLRPDNLSVTGKRQSVPKVVAFSVHSPSQPDLLAVNQEENAKASKPLTPYYPTQKSQQEQLNSAADPFDTSYVSEASKPGKLEVQILEKELSSAQVDLTKIHLSDQEFDPRGNLSEEPNQLAAPAKLNQDILSGDVDEEIKLHTPVVPRKAIEENSSKDVDPFDTSIASDLIPGKAEIKILEEELIYTTTPSLIRPATNLTEELLKKNSKRAHSSRKLSVDYVLEQDSEEITVKPLSPVAAGSFDIDDETDPFDTSAVENIAPGKTEIKLLESELLS